MKCPFCTWKQKRHQIFYETQNFVCMHNIRPVFAGHSLIIPKRHITTMLRMNEYEIEELPSVIKLSMVALKKTYKPQGYNLVVQEGAAAGASIKHLHFHILPRKRGDIPPKTKWIEHFKEQELKRKKLSRAEMIRNVKKIKRAINRLGRK